MTSRIKDLVEIIPVVAPADPSAGRRTALASYLLTYELGDALARIVELLAATGPNQRNCLIVGSSGCGKSTLLNVACDLLALTSSDELISRFSEIRMALDEKTVHPIRVELVAGERRLAVALEEAILAYCDERGMPRNDRATDDASRLRLDFAAVAAARLPEGERFVIAVDNLDEWLRSAGRYAYENIQTIVRLGELSRELPLATCAVAGSGVLSDEAGSAEGQGWMASLHADFQIVYVPANTVRTATASRVLRKNARQRREILAVLGKLREKLPELNYSDEEFVELYPLEGSTWTIGGHLHRWIEGFSFPEFAARAAESVRGRPRLSLFALNDMFARYEGDLRRVESLAPMFAAYDHLQGDAMPRLGPSQRLWASLALQSIFMHTIAGIAVDVITLTNSVLLYSLHGNGSSYVFMAAVLKQLESLGRGAIVASGEGSGRRYSLVVGQREAVQATVEQLADAIDDEDEIAWALASFGGRFFADWPIGGTARSELWDIAQQPGAISLQMRPVGGGTDGTTESTKRPRIVIFAPGRTWSEARAEASTHESTSVWIGGVATPDGRLALKQWLALTRLAASERGGRYADLDAFRTDLAEQCAAVFKRVYIDRGMLVMAWRSDAMESIVHQSRDENLVVRLLPVGEHGGEPTPHGLGAHAPAAEGTLWLAHLTADARDDVTGLAAATDSATWLQRLEAWYTDGINRDVSLAVRLLRDTDAYTPEAAAALEAKHQFDVVLFNVRKTLAAGAINGLKDSIETVFGSHDKLWLARERIAWLDRFAEWLATIDSAAKYLHESETVSDPDAEELKRSMLDWVQRLDGFADEARRLAFDDAFQTFKNEYANYYAIEHELSVAPSVIDRLSDMLLGSRSWRALEVFSSLPIGNPSYLVEATNHVSMLREAQCDADVRTALDERPRCVCGYRFGDRSRITTLASTATELLQSGIQYHRRQLQLRKSELRAKLKAQKGFYEVNTIKAIATLTTEDELPDIDDMTVAALRDLLSPSTE